MRLVYRNSQFRTFKNSFKIFNYIRLTYYYLFLSLSCKHIYIALILKSFLIYTWDLSSDLSSIKSQFNSYKKQWLAF